ncbi:hypothetical protein ARMGADRAFT_1067987 [Armillaria gallica]|uniref:Uncharacterized protein n=1 Tax=Armillaria gallica TaxID=47427 RepID=A0A2H3CUW7_ARMGA|nr:hypothetical protein ARMGADRAFT_1067987 [Armillaria gallica]
MNHVPRHASVPEAYILALLLDPYFSVHFIAAYSCSRRQFNSMGAFFEACLPCRLQYVGADSHGFKHVHQYVILLLRTLIAVGYVMYFSQEWYNDPSLYASTTYSTRFLRCQQLETPTIRNITRISKINYDVRMRMIPRIYRDRPPRNDPFSKFYRPVLIGTEAGDISSYAPQLCCGVLVTAFDGALRHCRKAVSGPPSSIMRSDGYKDEEVFRQSPGMPHHILSKTTTKSAHFANLPNVTYMYDSAHILSQTATYSSQRLFQRLSTSQQQQSYITFHDGFTYLRILSDLVIALYMAVRTRAGGKDVKKTFGKWVQNVGEEESKKGVRRVDFLLGFTKFVGIESMDEPGVWKFCLLPLS